MSEAAFLAWLQGVGIVAVLLTGIRDRYGAGVLALPVGLSAYVLTSALLLVLGLTHSLASSMALVSIVSLGLLVRLRERWMLLTSKQLLVLAASVLAVFAGSLLLQWANIVRVTPDSFQYVTLGSVLEQTGDLADAGRPALLKKRPVLVALLHAGADGLYRPSIAPLMGLAGLGTFAWLGWRCLQALRTPRPWAGVLLVAGLIAVVGTSRFTFHLFYVQGHLTFAVLILVAAGASWLAAQHRDRRWLWIAVLPLAAGVLARPEAPLLLVFLVIPVIAHDVLGRRQRWVIVGSFAATVLVWHGFTLRPALGGAWTDGAVLGPLAAAAGLLALNGAIEHPLLRRFRGWMPALAIGGLVVILSGLVLRDPDLFGASARATWENQVHGAGYWGATWLVLAPLVATSAVLARFRFRSIVLTLLVAVPPLFAALAHLRDGAYRVGTSDSANRMLIHVLLLAAFFVILTIGHLVASGRFTRDTHSTGAARRLNRPHRGSARGSTPRGTKRSPRGPAPRAARPTRSR